ncbi:hypothetical protein DIE03_25015 [Burkholderia sp. Bp8992]|nr:hypothetical protein DIE03_25015 [Burkholderia sp. Bp8992]
MTRRLRRTGSRVRPPRRVRRWLVAMIMMAGMRVVTMVAMLGTVFMAALFVRALLVMLAHSRFS